MTKSTFAKVMDQELPKDKKPRRVELRQALATAVREHTAKHGTAGLDAEVDKYITSVEQRMTKQKQATREPSATEAAMARAAAELTAFAKRSGTSFDEAAASEAGQQIVGASIRDTERQQAVAKAMEPVGSTAAERTVDKMARDLAAETGRDYEVCLARVVKEHPALAAHDAEERRQQVQTFNKLERGQLR